MRAPFRLIADDLTGALDALVRFAAPDDGCPPLTASWDRTPGAAYAWCSDSRDAHESTAIERVRLMSPWLLDAEVSLLKCDSRLRGHAVAELLACLGSDHVTRTVFVPTLPSQGRSFRGGRVYIARADDATPGVGQPGLPNEVPELADPVADFRAAGLGVSVLSPGQAVPDGISCWNASTESDLDRIVRGAITLPGKTLWCGSSGLAGALARAATLPAMTSATVQGPVLAIVGTRHPVTVGQVDKLSAARPEAVVRAGPDDASVKAAALVANRALERGESCCLLVTVPTGCTHEQAASAVRLTLARLIDRLGTPVSCLVTGGATLQALARLLHASALEVHGELLPGVPVCRFVGGRWPGTQVVSKSGGFGNRSLLRKVLLDDG